MNNPIFKFKFAYGTKLTDEEIEVVSQMLGGVEISAGYGAEKDAKTGKIEINCWAEYTGDPVPIIEKFPDIRLEISEVISNPNFEQSMNSSILALGKTLDRIEEATKAIGQLDQQCKIVVPGFGLLTIDEVIMADNYSTEDLQICLDDGWRILAICPQPEQRRPDYVLGRQRRQNSY